MELTGAIAIAAAYLCPNVIINPDALREIKLVRQGALPLSYQVYDGQDNIAMSSGHLIHCCKDLAFEYCLTQRETEVLSLLARGYSLAKIQDLLCHFRRHRSNP